jgi:hypothetical protein
MKKAIILGSVSVRLDAGLLCQRTRSDYHNAPDDCTTAAPQPVGQTILQRRTAWVAAIVDGRQPEVACRLFSHGPVGPFASI